MRDESGIQVAADKAASLLAEGQTDPHDKTTLLVGDRAYDVERLRGIRDALDWVLDEDVEDDPL